MGRRILQKVTHNGVTTYQRYQWCGTRICQQRPASGTSRTRSYLLTGEYDFTASKKYVYFTDYLKSVRDLADADTGARVGTLDYTPYGAVRASDGTLPDFRYGKLLWTGEVGLYASRTRFFDPGNTRWLNRDPILERGGINLYGYARANPVNFYDFLGLTPQLPPGLQLPSTQKPISCSGVSDSPEEINACKDRCYQLVSCYCYDKYGSGQSAIQGQWASCGFSLERQCRSQCNASSGHVFDPNVDHQIGPSFPPFVPGFPIPKPEGCDKTIGF